VGLTITGIAITVHVARVLFGAAPPLAAKLPRPVWFLAPALLLLVSLLSGVALAPPVLAALSAWTKGGSLP
jgi:hypothetical protein